MKILFINILFFFSIFIFITNCSDNSVGSHSEHSDAVGMRILVNEVTVVSYIRDAAVSGQIEIIENELSELMRIEFYDDETESWFQPDNEDSKLTIAITDTNIAQFLKNESEPGAFEFQIFGKMQGATQAEFSIVHDDHPDFVSKAVPIQVINGSITL